MEQIEKRNETDLVSITLTNRNGMEVRLLNLGATITSVSVPDGKGGRAELTLGYDRPEDYLNNSQYFGATPGRYANRIGGARFSLNGREYKLTANEGKNQLHGGETGFAKKYWEAREEDGIAVFTCVSEDGDNGYPGNLAVRTSYSLNDENELLIRYTAESDADTVINLTNHAYFNLAGAGTILDHRLRLYADSFVVTDKENIPTGEIRKAAGSAMDFSSPKRLGDAVTSDEEAIRNTNGLDSCFVLSGDAAGRRDNRRLAAVLSEPESGRTLEVLTDLPGIQVYSGQFIPEGMAGRAGQVYGPYGGVCLEAQNFPDAPNRPEFPSAVLKKGDTFRAAIVYRFSF